MLEFKLSISWIYYTWQELQSQKIEYRVLPFHLITLMGQNSVSTNGEYIFRSRFLSTLIIIARLLRTSLMHDARGEPRGNSLFVYLSRVNKRSRVRGSLLSSRKQ